MGRMTPLPDGLPDTYCVCEVLGRPDSMLDLTAVAKQTLSPSWSDSFSASLTDDEKSLSFTVYEVYNKAHGRDLSNDVPLGRACWHQDTSGIPFSDKLALWQGVVYPPNMDRSEGTAFAGALQ